jgi:hypothetical protein
VVAASLLVAFGQTAKSPSVKSLAILGKTKAQAERVLGRPIKADPKGSYQEAKYRPTGFKDVSVAYINGKLEVAEFSFAAAPQSWQAALKSVGISGAGVKAVRTPAQNGFDLTGIKGLPAKWSVTYFDSGAKLSFFGPNAT